VFGNLGMLTHTKRENPEQVIALCGCMAQEERVSKRVKESYRHVDLVFGPTPCGSSRSFCGRCMRPAGGCSPWMTSTAPSPRASPWCGRRA